MTEKSKQCKDCRLYKEDKAILNHDKRNVAHGIGKCIKDNFMHIGLDISCDDFVERKK